MNNEKKFDICLMNPPYDNRLHHKFLEKTLNIANKVCTVQPADWVLGVKKKQSIINLIDNNYVDIETVNGNEYFDAGIANNLTINYIDLLRKKEIIYDGVQYNSCNDIKLNSNDKLMTEFIDSIDFNRDNLWNPTHLHNNAEWSGKYYVKYEHPDNWCIKIPQIRGHVTANGKKESSDFYTIISNDNEFINDKCYGQWKKIKSIANRRGKLETFYYSFSTKHELDGFISYIKTDFARACLYNSKYNSNLMRSCLKYIPWFDFSDPIFSKPPREIDDYLFKKYNISDDVRRHIEEILPDYYSIRN